jgi:GDP-L-fucose synthase
MGRGHDQTRTRRDGDVGNWLQRALGFDTTKPDGTPRKLLDVSRLREPGWSPRIPLTAGIASAYAWFKEHALDARH